MDSLTMSASFSSINNSPQMGATTSTSPTSPMPPIASIASQMNNASNILSEAGSPVSSTAGVANILSSSSSTSTAAGSSVINQISAAMMSVEDRNNPFDVAENKEYFKSQDVEIKQLIINVKKKIFI
jgi:hypothetical protein